MPALRSIPLYHWSPISRRAGILRRGLRPGCVSRCGQWHPPYVCFGANPTKAWALSAALTDEAAQWDLWMVWSSIEADWRRRRDGGRAVIEWRARKAIPKRLIWHVGTREHTPRT